MKHKLSTSTIKVLLSNGWSQDRTVDTRQYEAIFKKTGQSFSNITLEFLRSFGGLKIGKYIEFDPVKMYPHADYLERYQEWIGKPLCVIGSSNPAILLMSTNGEIYSTFQSYATKLGATFGESLDTLLSGENKPTPIPLPATLTPSSPEVPSRPPELLSEIQSNNDWKPITQNIVINGISFEMCKVPAGIFQMGSDVKSYSAYPVHQNFVSNSYWLSAYPITNEQWKHAVEKSAGQVKQPKYIDWYSDPKKAQNPVVWINWYQCQEFVNWLGEGYRLPTELEWEFAARGPSNAIFPFRRGTLDAFHRYQQEGPTTSGTQSSIQSWVGAYDMIGRVLEWTNSQYKEYPYNAFDGREDLDNILALSLRGLDGIRRSQRPPHSAYNNTGMRLCTTHLVSE